MRVSISVADNIVVIDGEVCRSDCSELLASNISGVQWYGEQGEIEYVSHVQPNEPITDFAPYQSYVDNAVPIHPRPSAINPSLDSYEGKTIRQILGD
ncbi:hypothetical protein [Bradyrhizobium ivorense]|uniref:hypothetical protein n=1 Tax=Bradyrhizobium ivorense TaxID=2511166 RepID=UPI0010B877D8|nr:hypothetical protein [Bradyrhizobium ivorense]VIO80127.1 hypothetical protein CI41S_70870 [Bradyrhizobium ivorense]